MKDRPHISEEVLSRIWQEQLFLSESLTTPEGRAVHIIRRGRKNYDNGPDFKGVLIRIANEVYEGDVELHIEQGDWHAHGHDNDPAYDRTILHVVFWPPKENAPTMTQTSKGDVVPTVIVSSSLSEPIEMLQERFLDRDSYRQEHFHECRVRLAEMSLKGILRQLRQIGRERLEERVTLFEQRLENEELEQILYEAICEGLGYSSNKVPFRELAGRLPLGKIMDHLPQQAGISPPPLLWIQAMLFGTAGLLPKITPPDSETEAYVTELRSLWDMLAPSLDLHPMSAEQWHFFRLRPPNFPPRRLAALSYLIVDYTIQPLLEGYLQLFKLLRTREKQNKQNIRLLERTLEIPSSGYWKGRYLFGKTTAIEQDRNLLGQARIRDIIISAVLPVVLLYARQHSSPELESQIMQTYEIFPAPPWGRETKEVADRLFLNHKIPAARIRTAMLYQGILHLQKHFCALPACAQCAFGSRGR